MMCNYLGIDKNDDSKHIHKAELWAEVYLTDVFGKSNTMQFHRSEKFIHNKRIDDDGSIEVSDTGIRYVSKEQAEKEHEECIAPLRKEIDEKYANFGKNKK